MLSVCIYFIFFCLVLWKGVAVPGNRFLIFPFYLLVILGLRDCAREFWRRNYIKKNVHLSFLGPGPSSYDSNLGFIGDQKQTNNDIANVTEVFSYSQFHLPRVVSFWFNFKYVTLFHIILNFCSFCMIFSFCSILSVFYFYSFKNNIIIIN